jgi:integrase
MIMAFPIFAQQRKFTESANLKTWFAAVTPGVEERPRASELFKGRHSGDDARKACLQIPVKNKALSARRYRFGSLRKAWSSDRVLRTRCFTVYLQSTTMPPTAPPRGPKYIVKTPVLAAAEARTLLDSIPIVKAVAEDGAAVDRPDLVGLRDRALIGLMAYSFARVGAVLQMKVGDYFVQERRRWVRLHEKGGKEHDVPCHHDLDHFLDEYIAAAGIAGKSERRRVPPGRTQHACPALCAVTPGEFHRTRGRAWDYYQGVGNNLQAGGYSGRFGFHPRYEWYKGRC